MIAGKIKKINIKLLISLILFVSVLIIRRQDAFTNPQFWAEDGIIFFKQCYEFSWESFLIPYAGYIHLVPRLVAILSSLLCDYKHAPVFYNITALIIYSIIVCNIFSPRFKVKNKVLYSLSLVLVPSYGNEIFMNLTNVQWFMAILLVIVLLKEEPSTMYGNVFLQWIGDLMQLILVGLTGPFIILILPFYILKVFIRKSLHNICMMLIALFTSLIQIATLYASLDHTTHHRTALKFILDFFEQKVTAALFFGWTKYIESISWIYLLIYIAIITYLFFVIYKSRNTTAMAFIFCHFIFILAALVRLNGDQAIFGVANGNRYLFIPDVMLVWTILSINITAKNCYFVYSLLLLIFTSAITSDFRTRYIDYEWKNYSSKIGKESVEIPINPQGWCVHLEAKNIPKSNKVK